jgi:predicted lipase
MANTLAYALLISLVLSVALGGEYNKGWSQGLNKISAVTHCTKDQIINWDCLICREGEKLTNVHYIYNQATNVLGFIGYLRSKDAIVLAMRGTIDYKNWIEDFSYYQLSYNLCKGCLIHSGFYLDYLSVSPQISTALDSLTQAFPTAKVVVTGSSLGGALATVAALELQAITNKVEELHVFGCPRVGNANYAQYLFLSLPTVFRVVHNRDIVPHLPLVTQNYHHEPYEVLFDERMDGYRVCD